MANSTAVETVVDQILASLGNTDANAATEPEMPESIRAIFATTEELSFVVALLTATRGPKEQTLVHTASVKGNLSFLKMAHASLCRLGLGLRLGTAEAEKDADAQSTSPAAVFARADNAKRTPLHLAAFNNHLACCEFLLSSAVGLRYEDINKQDSGGYTPLYFAAYKGFPAIVRMLLLAGANPVIPGNKTDAMGMLPLHQACKLMTRTTDVRGFIECALCLVGRGPDGEVDTEVRSSILASPAPSTMDAQFHAAHRAQMFVGMLDLQQVPPVFWALRSGNPACCDLVKIMLGEASDATDLLLKTQDKMGNTALHCAVLTMVPSMVQAVLDHCQNLTTEQLATGLINKANSAYMTPLALAEENSGFEGAPPAGNEIKNMLVDFCAARNCPVVAEADVSDSADASTSDLVCPVCMQMLLLPIKLECGHAMCLLCGTLSVSSQNGQCPFRCAATTQPQAVLDVDGELCERVAKEFGVQAVQKRKMMHVRQTARRLLFEHFRSQRRNHQSAEEGYVPVMDPYNVCEVPFRGVPFKLCVMGSFVAVYAILTTGFSYGSKPATKPLADVLTQAMLESNFMAFGTFSILSDNRVILGYNIYTDLVSKTALTTVLRWLHPLADCWIKRFRYLAELATATEAEEAPVSNNNNRLAAITLGDLESIAAPDQTGTGDDPNGLSLPHPNMMLPTVVLSQQAVMAQCNAMIQHLEAACQREAARNDGDTTMLLTRRTVASWLFEVVTTNNGGAIQLQGTTVKRTRQVRVFFDATACSFCMSSVIWPKMPARLEPRLAMATSMLCSGVAFSAVPNISIGYDGATNESGNGGGLVLSAVFAVGLHRVTALVDYLPEFTAQMKRAESLVSNAVSMFQTIGYTRERDVLTENLGQYALRCGEELVESASLSSPLFNEALFGAFRAFDASLAKKQSWNLRIAIVFASTEAEDAAVHAALAALYHNNFAVILLRNTPAVGTDDDAGRLLIVMHFVWLLATSHHGKVAAVHLGFLCNNTTPSPITESLLKAYATSLVQQGGVGAFSVVCNRLLPGESGELPRLQWWLRCCSWAGPEAQEASRECDANMLAWTGCSANLEFRVVYEILGYQKQEQAKHDDDDGTLAAVLINMPEAETAERIASSDIVSQCKGLGSVRSSGADTNGSIFISMPKKQQKGQRRAIDTLAAKLPVHSLLWLVVARCRALRARVQVAKSRPSVRVQSWSSGNNNKLAATTGMFGFSARTAAHTKALVVPPQFPLVVKAPAVATFMLLGGTINGVTKNAKFTVVRTDTNVCLDKAATVVSGKIGLAQSELSLSSPVAVAEKHLVATLTAAGFGAARVRVWVAESVTVDAQWAACFCETTVRTPFASRADFFLLPAAQKDDGDERAQTSRYDELVAFCQQRQSQSSQEEALSFFRNLVEFRYRNASGAGEACVWDDLFCEAESSFAVLGSISAVGTVEKDHQLSAVDPFTMRPALSPLLLVDDSTLYEGSHLSKWITQHNTVPSTGLPITRGVVDLAAIRTNPRREHHLQQQKVEDPDRPATESESHCPKLRPLVISASLFERRQAAGRFLAAIRSVLFFLNTSSTENAVLLGLFERALAMLAAREEPASASASGAKKMSPSPYVLPDVDADTCECLPVPAVPTAEFADRMFQAICAAGLSVHRFAVGSDIGYVEWFVRRCVELKRKQNAVLDSKIEAEAEAEAQPDDGSCEDDCSASDPSDLTLAISSAALFGPAAASGSGPVDTTTHQKKYELMNPSATKIRDALLLASHSLPRLRDAHDPASIRALSRLRVLVRHEKPEGQLLWEGVLDPFDKTNCFLPKPCSPHDVVRLIPHLAPRLAEDKRKDCITVHNYLYDFLPTFGVELLERCRIHLSEKFIALGDPSQCGGIVETRPDYLTWQAKDDGREQPLCVEHFKMYLSTRDLPVAPITTCGLGQEADKAAGSLCVANAEADHGLECAIFTVSFMISQGTPEAEAETSPA